MLQGKLCVGALTPARSVCDFHQIKFVSQLGRLPSKRAACWPLAVAILCFVLPAAGHSQVTATLTGTVQDQSGGVIPGAQVTLTNDATQESRVEQTNGAGLYAFPSLVPGTYDIKASAKGFKSKAVTSIVLNAGDTRSVPALDLEVGTTSETVTVSATSEMIPVENGQRTDVLNRDDIANMALQGRDTTELLESLPGAVTQSGGLTQTAPEYGDMNVTVDESAVGSGVYLSGSIYRGGTSIEVDGAQTIDIGNMANSLVIIDPEMTEQVSVQSSNMSADQAFGPVVVSTISRSGSANYHGEALLQRAQQRAECERLATKQFEDPARTGTRLLSGRQFWRAGSRDAQEPAVLGRL